MDGGTAKRNSFKRGGDMKITELITHLRKENLRGL